MSERDEDVVDWTDDSAEPPSKKKKLKAEHAKKMEDTGARRAWLEESLNPWLESRAKAQHRCLTLWVLFLSTQCCSRGSLWACVA